MKDSSLHFLTALIKTHKTAWQLADRNLSVDFSSPVTDSALYMALCIEMKWCKAYFYWLQWWLQPTYCCARCSDGEVRWVQCRENALNWNIWSIYCNWQYRACNEEKYCRRRALKEIFSTLHCWSLGSQLAPITPSNLVNLLNFQCCCSVHLLLFASVSGHVNSRERCQASVII